MRFSCDGLFQKSSFCLNARGRNMPLVFSYMKKLLRIIFTLIGDQTKESKVHNIS